jgi:hypothetical protein
LNLVLNCKTSILVVEKYTFRKNTFGKSVAKTIAKSVIKKELKESSRE